MVQEQHRRFHPARHDGQVIVAGEVTGDTAPPGIPLHIFWALVDPIDRPEPRPSPHDA